MSRIFANFPEAANEIKRDLAELSIEVPPMYQSKPVYNDPNYISKELHNYQFTVLDPDYTTIPSTHDDWIKAEWEERIIGDLNPGRAWRQRPEVWDELRETEKASGKSLYVRRGADIHKAGRFSYTYSERMGGKHLRQLIDDLKAQPYSRQLWLPVWWPVDERRRGQRRVPCSLGYWFLWRSGQLHMTYVMRSCDFITHWPNDIALASILLHFVAHHTEMTVGTLTQFVGSLHVYAKDVEGVF